MKRLILLPPLLLTTAACATSQPQGYKTYLAKKGLNPDQAPISAQHCRGYGCKYIDKIELTAQDWREFQALFTPPPVNAEQERARLKPAIALFEEKAGAQTGTHADHWGTFRKLGIYQHDCVDESINTTIYLSLLQQKGHLKFHEIQAPTVRLPLIHAGRWPHQTAVIREKDSGLPFALDSWFHDNGHPPEIVPLKQWKDGYKPQRKG